MYLVPVYGVHERTERVELRTVVARGVSVTVALQGVRKLFRYAALTAHILEPVAERVIDHALVRDLADPAQIFPEPLRPLRGFFAVLVGDERGENAAIAALGVRVLHETSCEQFCVNRDAAHTPGILDALPVPSTSDAQYGAGLRSAVRVVVTVGINILWP